MKNKVEIKKGTVRKTYANRLDYIKEAKLYRMLKGTGLAPELIDAYDGCIEREYVEGTCFLDMLNAADAAGNNARTGALMEMFCSWYKKFRDITRLTLGVIRFDKFIVSGDRLCYLDFENCRPGYMEQDFAGFATRICLSGEPFSENSVSMARRFINVCSFHMDWIPELLALSIPKEMTQQASELGIFLNGSDIEYIKTVLTCAAGVIAGGKTPLEDCLSAVNEMPQCFISLPSDSPIDNADPRFIKTAFDKSNLLGRISEMQNGVTQPWLLVISTDYPAVSPDLCRRLLSADKDECAAVVVKGGGIREFPVLLNTERTRMAVKHACEDGETSLLKLLSGMRVAGIAADVK